MATRTTRSPLRDKPLRSPGQSLDEALNTLIDEKVVGYIIASTLFATLTMVEWYHWLWPSSSQPWLTTAVAALVVFGSYVKLRRYRALIDNLKLGRNGEREVGHALEALRAQGCLVFHDIQGPDFNLDHVVLARQGIYLIETKTLSKPKGDHRVTYDGKTVRVAGRTPERDPVAQAEALAGWLRGLLKESTGKRLPVRPVVVYPGWYVETKKRPQDPGTWVLNPKLLPGHIGKHALILKDEDLRLAE